MLKVKQEPIQAQELLLSDIHFVALEPKSLQSEIFKLKQSINLFRKPIPECTMQSGILMLYPFILHQNNQMKTINSLLTGLLLTASVFLTQQANAQAPQKMSYQSVIRNSSNVLLAGTQVGIRISVLQGSETGTAVYVETQTATTNGNGLLSIKIGTGTATTGTFAGINWAAGTYFIKTETDPAGGSNYSITGTQEMLSVPYALSAGNGISTAQADAIVTMQAQITALQAQSSPCGYSIGQNVTALGGIIFYLDPSGCHGLVCAPTDQSTEAKYGNYSLSSGTSTGTGLNEGKYNTYNYADDAGIGSAINICFNLSLGGKSDWYLPSIEELNKMYENIGQGNTLGLGNVGGFANNIYWSSTETDPQSFFVWHQNFSTNYNSFFGRQDDSGKNELLYVRAIRAF